MIEKIRSYTIPSHLLMEIQQNPITSDLYLCEIAEYRAGKDALWSVRQGLEHHLLIYCTKGSGIIQISNDLVPFTAEQYCIIPRSFSFNLQAGPEELSVFLTCGFDGEKTKIMEKDFTAVRDLVPSVNNLVANRLMLFDEIFNNLTKGFVNANYQYINFCFGHLLATFLYASRTGDDILQEQNPGVSRAIQIMESNLGKKLSLERIAEESGYSPSYFTTMFSKRTGYGPLSYFSHLKISKACEYLDFSKLKIKEISFALGYTDPYYFSKDFSRKMGLSPRNYRKRVTGRK
jgi:AraC family transcriptional regulator, arabinose operon regulatory protein